MELVAKGKLKIKRSSPNKHNRQIKNATPTGQTNILFSGASVHETVKLTATHAHAYAHAHVHAHAHMSINRGTDKQMHN